MTKILKVLITSIGVMLFLSILFYSMQIDILSSEEQKIEKTSLLIINTITPSLDFSTYLGGDGYNTGVRIAITNDGFCYVTGQTTASNFPTLNAYDGSFGGSRDAFVSKFSPNGSLLWSTYLGGSGADYGWGITVATDGSCCVTGQTASNNFPVKNAYNSTYGGGIDTFITKFSANGSLLWSTYLGGKSEEQGSDIASDLDGSYYIAGYTNSNNFPTLNAYNNTFSGYYDTFTVKFSANGSLLWSTYIGGNNIDLGFGIATASDGSCYITGRTESNNFPIINAYNNTYGGGWDAFVAKFSANGSLTWSTYLGGNNEDVGRGIAVSPDSSCYVTGYSESSNFPILKAHNSTFSGNWDVFVSKFSSNGTLLWSTYLGGNGNDEGYGITVADNGSCYVTGETNSVNFPIKETDNNTWNGYNEAFITIFSTNGSLLWSTFLGGNNGEVGLGIAIAKDGSFCLTGNTDSTNFPVKNAFDNTFNGLYNAFVTKFTDDIIMPLIANITHTPINPTNEETITIGCFAIDNSGILNVILYYKINFGLWANKEMIYATDNIYYTNIGPFNSNNAIKYYIEAVDDSVNHNIAIDNNNTQYYEVFIHASSTTPPTTTSPTESILSFGFLAVIVVMPTVIIVMRKMRK